MWERGRVWCVRVWGGGATRMLAGAAARQVSAGVGRGRALCGAPSRLRPRTTVPTPGASDKERRWRAGAGASVLMRVRAQHTVAEEKWVTCHGRGPCRAPWWRLSRGRGACLVASQAQYFATSSTVQLRREICPADATTSASLRLSASLPRAPCSSFGAGGCDATPCRRFQPVRCGKGAPARGAR